ncbi:MAG: phosphatidylglycerophosphatase A [Candidatus Izemoplasmatales bacterium]
MIDVHETFMNGENLKQKCIEMLHDRGCEVDDIIDIVFDLQKKYIPNLKREVCWDAVDRVLGKREVQYAILTGIELDYLAEEEKLREPLQSLVNSDNPLFGIDEILVLSICNLYGSIGLTNFGYVDKVKPGIIGKLDLEGKQTGKCHTFLDDIIGAIAAAAASSVAHNSHD